VPVALPGLELPAQVDPRCILGFESGRPGVLGDDPQPVPGTDADGSVERVEEALELLQGWPVPECAKMARGEGLQWLEQGRTGGKLGVPTWQGGSAHLLDQQL